MTDWSKDKTGRFGFHGKAADAALGPGTYDVAGKTFDGPSARLSCVEPAVATIRAPNRTKTALSRLITPV